VETCYGKETDGAYDEEEILSGQLTENAAVDVVVVEIERVLTMVSDVYDELVEMQNDCPKVSDDARETYRDGLHARDHDLLRVCKHRARDSVGRVFVSVVILSRDHDAEVLCQSPFHVPYDHYHGIVLLLRHGHVQGHARVVPDARSDGTSQS